MNTPWQRLRAWCLPEGRPAPGLLTLAAIAFIWWVPNAITPCFIEGDNNTIADFAAHGFPVPYQGILLTTMLHWGQALAPDYPWYGAALYVGHMLSLSLWLCLLWRVFRPVWLALGLSLVLMFFELRMLVFLDYTSTSVMLCASALGWAFLDVLERRPSRLRPVLWGLVFVCGMLVRPQGAIGAVAFLLPAGLWVLLLTLRDRPLAPEFRRLALVALLFFAPAAAGVVADMALRAVTLTPQQAEYDAFNSARGRFFRLPRAAKFRLANDPRVLGALHWERGDMMRALSWTMLDERKYTPQAMQALIAAATPKAIPWKAYRGEMLQRLAQPNPYLWLLLAPLPFLLLAVWRRQWPECFGLLLLPWTLGLACYMSLHFVFPLRVEFPYLDAAALVALTLAGWLADRVRMDRGYHAAAALCFALACVGVYQVVQVEAEDSGAKTVQARMFSAKLRILDQRFAGSVILAKSDNGLAFKELDPLQVPRLDFQPIQLGWSTFSPRFYQQIGALGVQQAHEVVDALVDRPDAYILGTRDWAAELSSYLSDPRGVRMLDVARFQDGTRLMRVVRDRR